MTQRTLLRHASGFSLVEMSVVLLVLGVLLASVLGPLRVQWQSERLRETRTRLDAAESALLGFVLQRGRLPCPADPTLVGSSAGLEDCGREQGTLPWQLLGIPEADAWGRRWLYAVSPGFADTSGNTPSPVAGCASPTPVPAIGISFTWCSAGAYTVSESGGGTSMVTNAVAISAHTARTGWAAIRATALPWPQQLASRRKMPMGTTISLPVTKWTATSTTKSAGCRPTACTNGCSGQAGSHKCQMHYACQKNTEFAFNSAGITTIR